MNQEQFKNENNLEKENEELLQEQPKEEQNGLLKKAEKILESEKTNDVNEILNQTREKIEDSSKKNDIFDFSKLSSNERKECRKCIYGDNEKNPVDKKFEDLTKSISEYKKDDKDWNEEQSKKEAAIILVDVLEKRNKEIERIEEEDENWGVHGWRLDCQDYDGNKEYISDLKKMILKDKIELLKSLEKRNKEIERIEEEDENWGVHGWRQDCQDYDSNKEQIENIKKELEEVGINTNEEVKEDSKQQQEVKEESIDISTQTEEVSESVDSVKETENINNKNKELISKLDPEFAEILKVNIKHNLNGSIHNLSLDISDRIHENKKHEKDWTDEMSLKVAAALIIEGLEKYNDYIKDKEDRKEDFKRNNEEILKLQNIINREVEGKNIKTEEISESVSATCFAELDEKDQDILKVQAKEIYRRGDEKTVLNDLVLELTNSMLSKMPNITSGQAYKDAAMLFMEYIEDMNNHLKDKEDKKAVYNFHLREIEQLREIVNDNVSEDLIDEEQEEGENEDIKKIKEKEEQARKELEYIRNTYSPEAIEKQVEENKAFWQKDLDNYNKVFSKEDQKNIVRSSVEKSNEAMDVKIKNKDKVIEELQKNNKIEKELNGLGAEVIGDNTNQIVKENKVDNIDAKELVSKLDSNFTFILNSNIDSNLKKGISSDKIINAIADNIARNNRSLDQETSKKMAELLVASKIEDNKNKKVKEEVVTEDNKKPKSKLFAFLGGLFGGKKKEKKEEKINKEIESIKNNGNVLLYTEEKRINELEKEKENKEEDLQGDDLEELEGVEEDNEELSEADKLEEFFNNQPENAPIKTAEKVDDKKIDEENLSAEALSDFFDAAAKRTDEVLERNRKEFERQLKEIEGRDFKDGDNGLKNELNNKIHAIKNIDTIVGRDVNKLIEKGLITEQDKEYIIKGNSKENTSLNQVA